MATKNHIERVLQATSVDLKDLDEAYQRDNPTDPDRSLYKLIAQFNLGNIFLARKGTKITAAAYTIAFPTGSSCLGGIFIGKGIGSTDSVLAVVRRCLDHLRSKGLDYVFTSVREKNAALFQTLIAAGFVEFYQRQIGLIGKTGNRFLPKSPCNKILDKNEIKSELERFSIKQNTPEKGTVLYCFWPHSLCKRSIDFLANSNLFAVSDMEQKNIVIAHTALAERSGGRWFVLPPSQPLENSIRSKKIGEIILLIGDDFRATLSEAIGRLTSEGVDKICAQNCGDPSKLAVLGNSGFSFEQPQSILGRKVSDEWRIKGGSLGGSLDTFFG